MNKIKNIRRLYLPLCVVAAAVISGCTGAGGEDESDSDRTIASDGSDSGMLVSLADYRFGKQDVGSNTGQEIVLSNVGVDTYPLNTIAIAGENPGDFTVETVQGVTLEPGDVHSVVVAFAPKSEGNKNGSLDIDYDVIRGIGSNAVEAIYYAAKVREEDGDYAGAAEDYKRYLEAGATTANKNRAMIKVPVLEESEVYGSDNSFELYRQALNMRDAGDIGGALLSLNTLLERDPGSYLADDAKYMRGYIKMADQSEYSASYELMQQLIAEHPDSNYIDTALYSQGISQAELGNKEQAEEIFVSLRERHTGVNLSMFEMQWPKDNYVSRVWFDKTEEQLSSIQSTVPAAATPAAQPAPPVNNGDER